MTTIDIRLPTPTARQAEFIGSPAKRKIVRAGRRGGKTIGVSIAAVEWFLAGARVLYSAPTAEQVGQFWSAVTRALSDPIEHGIFKKNEAEHYIERAGTDQRLKAKTAWNADSLRGDWADKLIFDEWQLCNEDAWGLVGAPMMLDRNGDVVFIYTPPSLRSRSTSKARDPQHAPKLFKKAVRLQDGGDPRWAAFHFSSHDNPHLSVEALSEISGDMTPNAYRMEILAEDLDEAPGALWTRKTIDDHRVDAAPTAWDRVIVSVDPSITGSGDEAGIVVCCLADGHAYLLSDVSLKGHPLEWARAAVTAHHDYQADLLIAETNQGGEMVELTVRQVDPAVADTFKAVTASKSKRTRAEPVSVKAARGLIHHVGSFPRLEDELCLWTPGDPSPNRLDAFVQGMTELLLPHAADGLDLS